MRKGETIIRRSVEDKEWDIYTADPALMRKLDKLFGPTETREEAHWYKLPLNAISIRKPTRKEMTEEQRKQALSRLKVARAKKMLKNIGKINHFWSQWGRVGRVVATPTLDGHGVM